MKLWMGPAAGLAAIAILVGGVACSDRDAADMRTSTQANSTQAVATQPVTSTATQAPSSAASLPRTGTMTTEELVKYAEPAIVRIQTSGGVGSGFFVSDDGYLITNNHVVAGQSGRAQQTVSVTLSDGTVTQGTVVGTDPRSDLALVKVSVNFKTSFLPLARLADVAIGEDVVAIGYALDLQGGEGPSYSVTRGIVSQKNRGISEGQTEILGSIQTDAAINHGNSGGPLLNLQGEVVGVNTSLVPDNTGELALGIGLAVGSDTVKAVYEEIRAEGRVSRGLLGVRSFEALRPAKARELGIPENEGGVVLAAAESVDTSGAAAKAGLRSGDVIVKIGDIDINTEADLAVAMIKNGPGTTVAVEFYRGGQKQTAQVTLGTPT